MGTVIGGLYLPKVEFADLPQASNRGLAGAGQMLQNQTHLLELTELERAQQAAHVARQWQMQHPDAALSGWQPQAPQTALGGAGLPQAPMMQQTFGGGMPPGAPMTVPGGQDLSQFATPGAPGQSPMGQPGPPQDPLRELMQTNPDAARIVQERMLKMQEGTLKRDIQKFEYVGRILQGVTDQASLQDAHKEIGRAYPDLVGKLPQTYSKEALAPWIARAFEVKERAALGLQEINARTNAGELALKERQLAGTIPEYVKGEGILNAHIDALMKRAGLPPGSTVPPEITEQAQRNVLEGKTVVSASQGTGNIVQGTEGFVRIRPGTNVAEPILGPDGKPLQPKPSDTLQKTTTLANLAADAHKTATELEDKGFQPNAWQKGMDKIPLGLGNYLVSSDYQRYRQAVTVFAQMWLYNTSGAQINESEWQRTHDAFFPQPGEDKEAVAQKRQKRENLIREKAEESKSTGRVSQAQPKPVGELNVEDTKAEIAALRARAGSKQP